MNSSGVPSPAPNINRNLFPNSVPTTQPAYQQLPFDDDDLPDDDNMLNHSFQTIDPIQSMLSYLTVDQLCPTTFTRFKERVFGIQQLYEDLHKSDAFFRSKTNEFYDFIAANDGLDLCANLFEFRTSVLDTLSPNMPTTELADLLFFCVIYRSSIEKKSAACRNYILCAQEYIELLFRTENNQLRTFFANCASFFSLPC